MTRPLAIGMTVLIVLSVLATPVLATPVVPDSILLDQESERIGEVTYDGEEYEIYHVDNRFGYASGVEVYVNGDRVESSSEAQAVIRAYAEAQGAADLGPDDVERLYATQANLSSVLVIAEELSQTIEPTDAMIAELKQETVKNNLTAYDVVANASLAFGTFNATPLDNVDTTVEPWIEATETLQAESTELIELIEARDAGEEVAEPEIFDQYVVTMAAYSEFDRTSSQVASQLADMSDVSQSITVEVYGVSEHGSEISMEFARLGYELGPLTERVHGIADQVDSDAASLDNRERMTDRLESDLRSDWDTRSNATTQVYLTIAGLGAVVLGIGGYAAFKKQRVR